MERKRVSRWRSGGCRRPRRIVAYPNRRRPPGAGALAKDGAMAGTTRRTPVPAPCGPSEDRPCLHLCSVPPGHCAAPATAQGSLRASRKEKHGPSPGKKSGPCSILPAAGGGQVNFALPRGVNFRVSAGSASARPRWRRPFRAGTGAASPPRSSACYNSHRPVSYASA